MNSFKHNLDREIKKQISEREISPSRDLWEEIQIQTQNNPSKKHHWNRVLLAACFVLICGLGTFLFINNKNEPPVQITKTEEDFPKKEEIVQPEKINSDKDSSKPIQERLVQSENADSEKQIEKYSPIKTNLPLMKENPSEIAAQIIQTPQERIMAKSDSVKIPKKKRYVDPSTLLFSVENKEAIEKTKGGSNVAQIDLNER